MLGRDYKEGAGVFRECEGRGKGDEGMGKGEGAFNVAAKNQCLLA